MRYGRIRAAADAEVAYYHCFSRVVDKRFVFGDLEKERFVKFMRAYEEFCGVRIVTFCVMSNHFHLLVEVPHRPAPELLPTDEELVRLVKVADCSYGSVQLALDLKELREAGSGAEELRERFFSRMWDVSAFLQILKQCFTQWFNGVHDREGTLWESRFKSMLVEGAGEALATMAAYIDLNPIRAGIVKDPKEYRWCGYAQAVQGRKRAREGLRIAIEARFGEEIPMWKVMAFYRKYLFEEGVERLAGEDGTPARRGFSEAAVEEVLKAGGKLGLYDALRCRMRYFCDGMVLGSKSFVEEFFRLNRGRFGARRESGARPLKRLDMPGLYTVRDLRSGVITPSKA
ncbi:MAG: hypothetical protein JWL59_1605 [Chthoniobacteraceae bacterium]|nr:hypothetical protein [Chthoniobacteraceae bacterium]